MRIKDSVVTFWFQKLPNPKIYVDNFNSVLSDYFFEFNTIGVPANIDPDIPRLTAISNSNHSNISVSLISTKLTTNFDDNYSDDIDACIKYLKDRALKLYESLIKCGIDVAYSSIFINLDEKDNSAVEKIKNHFLKNDNLETMDEVGIRLVQVVEEKFYNIISFNNSKQIKFEKTFEGNAGEIIFPLISLSDANEVDDYLSVSLEFNDKYSFNLDSNYTTNKNNLIHLFDLMIVQLQNEMSRFK